MDLQGMFNNNNRRPQVVNQKVSSSKRDAPQEPSVYLGVVREIDDEDLELQGETFEQQDFPSNDQDRSI